MKQIKSVKLNNGEILIFEELDHDLVAGKLKMRNPVVIGRGPQGMIFIPYMPWAVKGVDYIIDIATSNVFCFFPEEQSKSVFDEYLKFTSVINLAAMQ